MTQLGYEPAELAGVFEMLARVNEASGSSLPTWASTHPAPEDRQERILAMANDHPQAERVARADYLRTVEGLTFGADPREGFFRDGVFHHPELRFRLDIPSGWRGVNTRNAVQAMSENQRAAIVLTLAEAASRSAALSAFEEQQGVTITGADERTVNGVPAVLASSQATTEQGDVQGTVMFPELGGQVYAVYGYSSASDWPGFQDQVNRSITSFQQETDQSILAMQPNHLEVVEVPAGMSFAEFEQRYPSAVPESTVALINQVEQDGTLPDGLAKRVTSG